MSTSSVLANVFSSIVNSRQDIVFVPYYNFAFNILKKIAEKKLFSSVEKVQIENSFFIKINKKIEILNIPNSISKIELISKPSCKVYSSISELRILKLKYPLYCYIISTSKGVLSLDEAINLNTSGELICKVSI